MEVYTTKDPKQAWKVTEVRDRHMDHITEVIGICWRDLIVRGYDRPAHSPSNLAGAFWSSCKMPYSMLRSISVSPCASPTKELDILVGLGGLAKPGELVLVLGKPGSGCSSFLKALTAHTSGFSRVLGDIRYGEQDQATFKDNFDGELLYNHEVDTHHPSLTVEQALVFAASTRRPSNKSAIHDEVNSMLRVVNLEHVRNTLVGNAYIRGLSGGERKRLSIAEMMLARAAVNAWDSPTRGLDAASALDFVVTLRQATRLQKGVTFVTIYQASESIYTCFDQVLVLEQGRQIYFGSTDKATQHFEALGFQKNPRQTTPDFLTGCADPNVRVQHPSLAPLTAEHLATLYRDSPVGLTVRNQLETWLEDAVDPTCSPRLLEEAREAPQGRRGLKTATNTVPYHVQVRLLVKRQFLLRLQDRLLLAVSFFTTFAFAIVLGTLWLRQPKTAAGAFTRGGVLYIGLLVNTGQAFGELASAMLGRPLMNKHRDYRFHRPSALWLGQIVVDTCFASIQILVFSITVYFLCGLVREPGAFFTYYVTIITTYVTLTALFRAIGCISTDYDWALKLSATLLTLFVLAGGYLIQYQQEPLWLRWIYWINPFALGFSILMINEFQGIKLQCKNDTVVPTGLIQYADPTYQTCLIRGVQYGEMEVPGNDYIRSAYTFLPSAQWRNFGILVVLSVTFLVIQIVCAETLHHGEDFKHHHLAFVRPKEKITRVPKHVDSQKPCLSDSTPSVLTFKDLCYHIKTKAGDRKLLNDMNGIIRPGELTALMGASGAGKTTLLDVLSLRKTIGVVEGSVLLNGKALPPEFRRRTAYAEQTDLHEPTQTIREAMRFAAMLRQDFGVSKADKLQHVEKVIELLELNSIADAIIGDSGGGCLSAEQMKRLTIGVELAAKPDLLLFLDEPTTGLDSQSAFNIVRILKKLASHGQAVLCTIHQPNSLVFASFDNLLLLQTGGDCIYFGDIGADATTLRRYFASHGVPCPPDVNVAEWILEATRLGKAEVDWVLAWRQSHQRTTLLKMIDDIKEKKNDYPVDTKALEYATPDWYQIRMCCIRATRAFWRNPKYASTQIFNHFITGLLTGLTFININFSPTSLQYRMFIIFQVTMLPTLIVAQIVPKVHATRAVFHREAAARTYGTLGWAISQLVSDLPFSILCATSFYLPLYFLPSFSSSGAGYQYAMVLLTELFSVTMGQLLAALTPTTLVALFVNPFLSVAMTLFCGIPVPASQMPKFWREWLYPLNPFTYLVNGMAVVSLHGSQVECSPLDFYNLAVPPGQTCGNYMANFFEHGGRGYVSNTNITKDCLYCPFASGDQYLDMLGLSYASRYRELGIYTVFLASNILLFLIACRFLSFNRR